MNNINLDLKTLKILVVDDTPANLGLLRETLEPQGYKLLYANSGEKALEIAFSNFPDLILLDVMMPGIDGYETCRRLKDNVQTKDIPIIFITAKIETEDIVQGFQQGGVDYILKPFRPEEISARVGTHLELSELRKRLDEKVREQTQQLRESRLEVVQRLGTAAEYKDNETGMHVIRMSHFSALLGKAYGLDEEECELLLISSPMHDIGKNRNPRQCLVKTGETGCEGMGDYENPYHHWRKNIIGRYFRIDANVKNHCHHPSREMGWLRLPEWIKRGRNPSYWPNCGYCRCI